MSVSNFDSIGARRRRRRRRRCRRDNVAAAAAAEANLHGFKSSDRLEVNKSDKFQFSDLAEMVPVLKHCLMAVAVVSWLSASACD